MKTELDAEGLPVDVRILGVNLPGLEVGNPAICDGRDLPWLQDTVDDDVWSAWEAEWRDVIILDENNVPVDVYNLTIHPLEDEGNREELKAKLRALATP
jgi:hypothetical protein